MSPLMKHVGSSAVEDVPRSSRRRGGIWFGLPFSFIRNSNRLGIAQFSVPLPVSIEPKPNPSLGVDNGLFNFSITEFRYHPRHSVKIRNCDKRQKLRYFD